MSPTDSTARDISRGFFCSKRVKFRIKPEHREFHLFSHILNRIIHVNLGVHSLKDIDYYGGLDAYLLSRHPSKLNSILGVKFRELLISELEKHGYKPREYYKFLLSVEDKPKVYFFN